ncbi:hypothetical protein [Streptomyces rimosus]|uniref:hypothetical protein n=1 Tax=Streptomyces rimosus TaxID=1927 RepID=UPI00131A8A65|nr:hypothetical protein [Streptomyces rimosus]
MISPSYRSLTLAAAARLLTSTVDGRFFDSVVETEHGSVQWRPSEAQSLQDRTAQRLYFDI